MTSIRDIAFIAGFYEGEGFCRFKSKDKRLEVIITQNDREILDRIQSLIGGKVYGPYKNSKGNNYYNWTIKDSGAFGFLLTIFTFLSKSRRKQAKLALEGKEGGRDYEEFTDLDKMLREQSNWMKKNKIDWNLE